MTTKTPPATYARVEHITSRIGALPMRSGGERCQTLARAVPPVAPPDHPPTRASSARAPGRVGLAAPGKRSRERNRDVDGRASWGAWRESAPRDDGPRRFLPPLPHQQLLLAALPPPPPSFLAVTELPLCSLLLLPPHASVLRPTSRCFGSSSYPGPSSCCPSSSKVMMNDSQLLRYHQDPRHTEDKEAEGFLLGRLCNPQSSPRSPTASRARGHDRESVRLRAGLLLKAPSVEVRSDDGARPEPRNFPIDRTQRMPEELWTRTLLLIAPSRRGVHCASCTPLALRSGTYRVQRERARLKSESQGWSPGKGASDAVA
ncbi:unnamed protein product [Lampetra fluviatilis]